MKRFSKVLAAGVAGVLCTGLCMSVSADSWQGYRGNDDNNAVVTAKIPAKADEAALYWATKIGADWTDSPSSVTLVNDKIVFTSGTKLYSMDKQTGEVSESTTELAESTSWSMIAPCYADGMIFVGLSNGVVQAFDADTLESLWVYKDELGGQPNSPFTYSDGKVYTGFWNSETSDADFVCIDVADEDTDNATEEKTADWTYAQKGGFYWTGAYANENFVAVATDDGESGSNSESGKVIAFDKATGEKLDEIDNIYGDVRSSLVYDKDTDSFYFTSKGGLFCSVKISADGKFSDYRELILNGTDDKTTNAVMTTSSPVVANGRAYIGVSGQSAYMNYSGSGIMVIDLDSFSVAYKSETMGYPQVSGLASVGEDGYNYVYFVENTSPSEIRFVKDKKGVTQTQDATTEIYNDVEYNCAPVLFTPAGEQANYAISNLICDEDGTIYFKNDSSYIMAVGSAVESIEASCEKTLYKAGESFDKDGLTVTATLSNGEKVDVTDKVEVSTEALTEDDIFVTVVYDYALYQDKQTLGGANQTGVEVAPIETTVDVNVLDEKTYDDVENTISLIDEIGTVTAESGEQISAVRESYDALDDYAKGFVSNYSALEEAEKAFAKLGESSSESSSEESSESSSESEESSDSESSDVESSDSSEESADDSESSSDTSKDDASSKPSGSTANPSTGFAQTGTALGITALLGAVVVKMRKKK